jgi:hypothetical protein
MPVKTRSMTKAELLKKMFTIKTFTKATNTKTNKFTYKTKPNLRIVIIENNIVMATFLIIILICVDCVFLCIPENY